MIHSKEYSILLNSLDKAEQGPVLNEKDWDLQYISQTVSGLVKKYGITWDQDDPIVPWDDDFADRVFQAGMELALETGVFCLDTKRQMLWSQDELDRILVGSPKKVTAGAGDDAVEVFARRPDDDTRVAIFGGPWGVAVPEELYPAYIESYAREPVFDLVENATLLSTHGRMIRAGSPWEAVAGWQEAQMALQAVSRAGRPDVALGTTEIATTEVGELAATTYGGYRPTDIHHAAFISEQKVSYDNLTKAMHIAHTGSLSEVYFNPMYGGFMGGGPGVAVAIVSGMLLVRACFMGTFCNSGPTHVHLDCSTHPDLVTATALAFQGLARNTNLMTSPFVRPTTGPGTREIFYESAALTFAAVVSGASLIDCVQSATGNNQMHATPLEARFCGELAHAVEGMTRKDADPIVRWLVEQYEHIQGEGLIGQPFTEVYDLGTLQPTNKWYREYESVCKEIQAEFGIELN
jgi:methylamine---corrinoid protein Co-methyltransferase